MKTLKESGLFKNDLDHLILPLIEIDIFESKIDNEKAVVLAFYVFEQDPAKDLEIFIEKSDISLLDTETSPAPTEDGYYVVFIEITRDIELPEIVMSIIDQVNNLTSVEKWQFKSLSDDKIYDLTKENLEQHVILHPSEVPGNKNEVEDELAETIGSILKNGLMESVEFNNDVLQLSGPGIDLSYRLVHVSENQISVPILAPRIGDPLLNERAKLCKVLGPAYMVETVDDGLLISSDNGYIVVEPVD